jgi:hypothetical protein
VLVAASLLGTQHVIRLYLTSIFAVCFLDLFDKCFERYGVRIKNGWEPLPDKAIVFGVIEGGFDPRVRAHRDMRFFIMKIPIVTTWGITNLWKGPIPEYGFRSHKLMWIEGWNGDDIGIKSYRGWRIDPPLEG